MGNLLQMSCCVITEFSINGALEVIQRNLKFSRTTSLQKLGRLSLGMMMGMFGSMTKQENIKTAQRTSSTGFAPSTILLATTKLNQLRIESLLGARILLVQSFL